MADHKAYSNEIPTFSGLPHERLEDYERDLTAYVLGTKEADRPLIGPRLLRRLGGLPGELCRRHLEAKDLAVAKGPELIIAFLKTHGYTEIRVDRKSAVQQTYDRVIRHPRESVQSYFTRENIAVCDLLKEKADISNDTRVHNMLGRSGLTDDRIALIYATCKREDDGSLLPQKLQDHVIKLFNKPWRHGDSSSSQGSQRSNFPVGIYTAATPDDEDEPWWARTGDPDPSHWWPSEWNAAEPPY